MQLSLIKNNPANDTAAHRIARIIYAETRCSSLPAVEALAAMIGNICKKTMRQFDDIATDENIFESLKKESARCADLLIAADDPKFLICLRAAKRMTDGALSDSVRGATRFHRAENSPDWSQSLGYVAEVDGLLFYL
jgi:hypothetical protein